MFVTVCVLGVVTFFGSAVATLTQCNGVSVTAAHLGVTHSLCQPKSQSASTPISIDASEQQTIVDKHNEVRRDVVEPATNMLQMEWDDDLANLAEKWASACIEGHDDNLARHLYRKTNVGQNIYMSTAESSWTNAMTSWAAESQYFTYGVTASGEVGHYTQMVWATTHKVGCSYVQCSNLEYGHRYICNYGPAGNINGLTKPYINGNQASSCGNDNNNNGLCDCTGHNCYNEGTLNPATCDCNCHNAYGITSADGVDCGTLSCKTGSDFDDWCNNNGLSACRYSWKYCPDFCNWC